MSLLLRTVVALLWLVSLSAQATTVKQDYFIDADDPGIKLFVRSNVSAGQTRFTDDNIVILVHGATYPSTPDFDLSYKDYSWADWMVDKGYVVYLFDKRNYGFSTREKAMDEPAANNKPVTRSYLAIRDIGAVVDHVRRKHHVDRVTLIGWSWGATTAGFYTSLNSEKVKALVMYAPAYALAVHTNLGAGTGLQNKRKPHEFNYALGAYRLGTKAANDARWDGEIPVADKSSYREEGVREAFALEASGYDQVSNSPAMTSVGT